jgi:hypothetical protein
MPHCGRESAPTGVQIIIELRLEMSASKPLTAIAVLAFSSMIVTGCTRTSRFDSSSANPAPLTPNPVGVVESKDLQSAEPLQPGVDNPADPNNLNPGADANVRVAAVQPPAGGGQDVTREALIGAWQVNTGGSQCQIFLALTKWSGGYRAASRGCAATALLDVQAWDVKGKQVVLVDSSGAIAARLYRSATTRYDGSTASGSAISFTR